MKSFFTLAPIFTENMMFQANKPIRIFGTCKKGIEIKVEFLNRRDKIRTKSDTFMIELEPFEAIDKGFSFTVKSKKQVETISGCLIGDIYLFGGGMNVDLPLKESSHEEDIFNKNIRIFDMSSEETLYHFWKVPGIESLGDSSAIAYVFAKLLEQKQSNPIGVISCSKCDSTIFSLLSLKEINSQVQMYNYVKEHDDEKDKLITASIYEKIIMRIIPMSLKSIIIYQGENDYYHYNLYASCMSRIITSYRFIFKDSTLPYIIVQLAGHNYPNATDDSIAHIRQSQSQLAKDANKVYIASAIDIGDKESLVLKNKSKIAKRIVDIVLEKIYKKGKNSVSPVYYSHQKDDDGIVIYTKNNYLDLVSKSGRNLGFKATKDGVEFFDLKSVSIKKNKIIVRRLQNIKEIRYAYQKYPTCDIFTTNDLPLLPFAIKLIE